MAGIETCREIGLIDAAAWDRLAAGSALESHGWLKTMEEASLDPSERIYFVLGGRRRPRGVAACRFEARGMQPPGQARTGSI